MLTKLNKVFLTTPISIFAVLIVVALEASLALWIGLPGQLSTDSIIQLYEGRTHQGVSWNPPLMSVLLGIFDRIGNAPILFVIFSQLLLSLSIWILFANNLRSNYVRFLFALFFIFNPILIEYAGIVWKDVLLAHAVVLLFLSIAHFVWNKKSITPFRFGLLFILLIIVVGVRQQGVLFASVAAVWMAILMAKTKLNRIILSTLLIISPLVVNKLLIDPILNREEVVAHSTSTGFKILMQYDLVGILANGGKLPEHVNANIKKELINQTNNYSAYRVDTLITPTPTYSSLAMADVFRLSSEAIQSDFSSYAKHRLLLFSALIGLRDTRQCNLMYSGIGGPTFAPGVDRNLNELLELTAGPNHSTKLVNQTWWDHAENPIFQHWIYAIALLIACYFLFKRKEFVLLSLSLCSLVFLSSYLVLGISCDFRYAYTLTVTTSLVMVFFILSTKKINNNDVNNHKE